MAGINGRLSTVNKQSYTNRQSEITKPVNYNASKGRLEAKGPLASLLMRMKATLTGRNYQSLVRGSVDKALANYAKAKFGAGAKSSFMATANKEVGVISKLEDAVSAIHSAAGDVVYAKVDSSYLAARKEQRGAAQSKPVAEENIYELEDLSAQDNSIYSEAKALDDVDDGQTTMVENEIYETSSASSTKTARTGDDDSYSTAAPVKSDLYEDMSGTKKASSSDYDDDNIYEDIEDLRPQTGKTSEPEYDNIGEVKKTDYDDSNIYEDPDDLKTQATDPDYDDIREVKNADSGQDEDDIYENPEDWKAQASKKNDQVDVSGDDLIYEDPKDWVAQASKKEGKVSEEEDSLYEDVEVVNERLRQLQKKE